MRAQIETHLAEVSALAHETLRQQMLRPEHYRRTIADRVVILQALKAGDGIAAREAMRTMVEVVRYRFFEEQGAVFDNEPAAERV